MADELKVTFEDVKKFMEENKATQEVLDFTKTNAQAYLETEDGKKFLQPKLDSFFSKGLDTWKEKSLPTVIEDEIKKRNPEETPQEKRIRELEDKISKQEKDKIKMELNTLTTKELSNKGLPAGLVDYLNFDTEEVMRDGISKVNEMFKPFVDKAVETRLKDTGKTPKGKQETGFDEKTMTKEKLLAMSTKESTEFFNQNPELFRQLMSSK